MLQMNQLLSLQSLRGLAIFMNCLTTIGSMRTRIPSNEASPVQRYTYGATEATTSSRMEWQIQRAVQRRIHRITDSPLLFAVWPMLGAALRQQSLSDWSLATVPRATPLCTLHGQQDAHGRLPNHRQGVLGLCRER